MAWETEEKEGLASLCGVCVTCKQMCLQSFIGPIGLTEKPKSKGNKMYVWFCTRPRHFSVYWKRSTPAYEAQSLW